MIRFVVVAISFLFVTACFSIAPAYAEPISNGDPRYCEEPKRNAAGKIIRSRAVRLDFEAKYPLPSHLKRSDFQVNHPVPLVCGGCDTIENMIWMHTKAKTCADDWCQDRHEQITMCPNNFSILSRVPQTAKQ